MPACPICAKAIDKDNKEFRPFCSDRCKTIDLGRWLSASYSVPVVEEDDLPDEPDEQSEH